VFKVHNGAAVNGGFRTATALDRQDPAAESRSESERSRSAADDAKRFMD